MESNHDRSIVPRPSLELTAALPVPNRILCEMVESSLALAKGVALTTADLDMLVSEGKRIQRREGMTPEDIQAFRLFHQASTAGNPEAQYHLCLCYIYGCGVQPDGATAIEWLRKSAESEFAAAQYLLGGRYESGIDVQQDIEEGERWIRRAAARGHADAQYDLGEFYSDGRGGYRDYSEAAEWYHKAAVQGHTLAQFELGLYFSGGRRNRSFTSCPERVHASLPSLFFLTPRHPSFFSYPEREFMKEYLNECVTDVLAISFSGEKVPFEVLNAGTGEVVIPANRRITKVLLRKLPAVRDQLVLPPSPLRDCIRDTIIRFERTAASWFRRAAAQGNSNAQRNLAICYQRGEGVEMDLPKACAWYHLAAHQKAEDLQRFLAESGSVLSITQEDAESTEREAKLMTAAMSPADVQIATVLFREFKEKYSAKRSLHARY